MQSRCANDLQGGKVQLLNPNKSGSWWRVKLGSLDMHVFKAVFPQTKNHTSYYCRLQQNTHFPFNLAAHRQGYRLTTRENGWVTRVLSILCIWVNCPRPCNCLGNLYLRYLREAQTWPSSRKKRSNNKLLGRFCRERSWGADINVGRFQFLVHFLNQRYTKAVWYQVGLKWRSFPCQKMGYSPHTNLCRIPSINGT